MNNFWEMFNVHCSILIYSYRRDSIGSIREARTAGHNPLSKPTSIRMPVVTARTSVDSINWTSVCRVGSSIMSASNGRLPTTCTSA